MMNDTVARIVDLMFEDTEMTEEVAALRDEVMNNCQERYSDLVASGMNEDDAIAAVIESLKGMEDVVSQYSRKSRRNAERQSAQETFRKAETSETQPGERHLTFPAGEIHQLLVNVVSEDVTLEASDDADYHVLWVEDEEPRLNVQVKDGVLQVERLSGVTRDRTRREHIDVDGMDDMFIKTDKDKMEISFDSLGDLLKSVGQTVKVALSRGTMHIVNGFNVCEVTVRIPAYAIPHTKLMTTSGDIEVREVALADLQITSTSGDIEVELEEEENLSRAEIRTTSGDIEAEFCADTAVVTSTSGDVELEGRVDDLTANTISGNIDVDAEVKIVRFKTVSGDAQFAFQTDAIREVRGSTVSGDIDIDLPDGLGMMSIHTQTRSGDVCTRYSCDGAGPTVTGEVSTLSGDITIR